jgi:hypothetical protein
MLRFDYLTVIGLIAVSPQVGYGQEAYKDLPNAFFCTGGSTAEPIQIVGILRAGSAEDIPSTYDVSISSGDIPTEEAALSPSLSAKIDADNFPLEFVVDNLSDGAVFLVNRWGRRTSILELRLSSDESSILDDGTVFFAASFGCERK